MRYFLPFAIVLTMSMIAVLNVKAQNQRADSLDKVMQKYKYDDTTKVRLLNELGYAVYLIDKKRTQELAQQSLELSGKLNYAKGKAEALWLDAITYPQSNPMLAKAKFEEALKIASEINDQEAIIKYTIAVGTIYGVTKKDSVAIEY